MSHKFMSFLCFVWFLSVFVCLIIEGSYWGTTENTVINNLAGTSALKIGGIVAIASWGIEFFHGVVRILLWDYSFYEGGYSIMRYFWLATLTPGALWGIGSVFAPVFANFLRLK